MVSKTESDFDNRKKRIISEMDITYESDEVLDSRFEQIEQLLRQIPEKDVQYLHYSNSRSAVIKRSLPKCT